MTTVAAIVVAFGDVPLLRDCVAALSHSHDVDVGIVVVDNGADANALAAASALPGVTVVHAPSNLGFGAGCNLGAAESSSEVVAFVNPDVVVEPSALSLLVATLSDDTVGVATASVRLLEEPALLNSSGGAVHFLGMGWADGFGTDAATGPAGRDVIAASGAAMAMRRHTFDEVGGFTAELFLYHEDAELSIRCWLAGFRVRYVPEAVVHHHYEFGRNPGKFYYLERNRLCLVLTCYAGRTILVLAPALAAYELGMLALAVTQGWARQKAQGWLWLVRNRRWLVSQRHRVQQKRRVTDRELVPLLAARFTGSQVVLPAALRPADAALALYWRAVSRLV